MSRPNLGKFILSVDYPKCSEDDDETVGNKLIDIESDVSRNVTIKEIKEGFAAFETKVCVKGFPPRHSGPYWAAYGTTCVLTRLLRNVVDDDEKLTTEAAEILLHAWEALVRAGPNSTQMDMMEAITKARPDVEKYVQTLPSNRIGPILKTLTIDIVYQKGEELDERTYGSFLHNRLGRMYKTFTKEQCNATQGEFLEVSMHYQRQLPNLHEHLADGLNYIIRDMRDKFEDNNPYLHMKDLDVYKKQLSVMEGMVFSGAMRKGTVVAHVVERTMKYVIAAIMADDSSKLLDGLFDPLMEMVIRIFKHEEVREHAEDIFHSYRLWLYQGMKEKSKVPTDAMFRNGMNMVMELLSTDYLTKETMSLIETVHRQLAYKKPKLSLDQKRSILALVKGFLLSGRSQLVREAEDAIDSSKYMEKKLFVWKELVPEACALFDAVGELPAKKMEDDQKSACADRYWTVRKYQSVIENLLEYLRKAKVLPQIQKNLLTCVFNCLDDKMPDKISIARTCCEDKYMDLSKLDKSTIDYMLQRIDSMLKNKDLAWENMDLICTVQELLTSVLKSYFGRGNEITPEENKLLLSIAKTVCEGDSIEDHFYQQEETDRYTVHLLIYQVIFFKLIELYKNQSMSESLAPVIPDIIKWAFIAADEEHDTIMTTSLGILQVIMVSASSVLKDFLPQIVDLLLKTGKCSDLYALLYTLYPMNPTAIHDRLQDLFDLLDTLQDNYVNLIVALFSAVSQAHPEVFNDKHISKLLQLYKTCSNPTQYGPQMLMIIRAIAEKCTKKLEPHFQTLIDDRVFKPESLNMRSGIILYMGGLNETLGQKSIDYLMKYVNYSDPNIAHMVLSNVRSMTSDHVDFMQKYRATIEGIETATTNPNIKETCHQIVLILDGFSIEGVIDDIKQQQEDITELDTKVDATICTVITIGDRVTDHHRKIGKVEKGLEEVEERVDEAENDINDTKIKVEEIDNKTMTNAPKWSRDLTRLMNPAADNDWRLLASRLGYSNTDIRGWAQQNDPCMALLSEWYATHKTSEASHAVLTALQEMNRVDGAVIVENAMKAAEGVVEDEEFEYSSPPPVFISYQWGIQDEVRLLQQHLTMAGYPCWMDIGQMGGGDKLFAKIDSGIRAAKIVICCTTEKYAQSPNCNREVNLAVNLGKPIIPLLMEKMDWPPKGSMGPIFSEYLFIRFFQRGGEETTDQRYWPVPKFQELLMQLNFFVVPDGTLIKKEYKDWWKPMVEEIVIDKDKKMKTNASKSNQLKEPVTTSDTQPTVFLSYQWGKQPQIKALYQRLTRLGYTVWMDIYQMGGGDSLYDKIDRGLRGCETVVSCVTPKYSLSANCRREISLADALKKPIIPLLLEQMKWPPDGPMSMVFTELLYINFYREPEVQNNWTGATFDELLIKLRQHVPEIKPSSESEPTTKAKPIAVDKAPKIESKQSDSYKATPSSVDKTSKIQSKQTDSHKATPSPVDKTSKIQSKQTDSHKATPSAVDKTSKIQFKRADTNKATPSAVDKTSKIQSNQADTNKATPSPVDKTSKIQSKQADTNKATPSAVDKTSKMQSNQADTNKATPSAVDKTSKIQSKQSDTSRAMDKASKTQSKPIDTNKQVTKQSNGNSSNSAKTSDGKTTKLAMAQHADTKSTGAHAKAKSDTAQKKSTQESAAPVKAAIKSDKKTPRSESASNTGGSHTPSKSKSCTLL